MDQRWFQIIVAEDQSATLLLESIDLKNELSFDSQLYFGNYPRELCLHELESFLNC
jgi:hypothetical protein